MKILVYYLWRDLLVCTEVTVGTHSSELTQAMASALGKAIVAGIPGAEFNHVRIIP